MLHVMLFFIRQQDKQFFVLKHFIKLSLTDDGGHQQRAFHERYLDVLDISEDI